METMTQAVPERVRPVGGSWDALSRFIATQSLGVFLVVFYSMVVYPRQEDERAKWIQKLERIGTLVDPTHRPLSDEQARIMVAACGECYVRALELEFVRQVGTPDAEGFCPLEHPRRAVRLFGHDLRLPVGDGPAPSANAVGAETAFGASLEKILDREIDRRHVLAHRAIEQARVLSEYSLSSVVGLFGLRDGTPVRDLWRRALDAEWTEFEEDVATAYSRESVEKSWQLRALRQQCVGSGVQVPERLDGKPLTVKDGPAPADLDQVMRTFQHRLSQRLAEELEVERKPSRGASPLVALLQSGELPLDGGR